MRRCMNADSLFPLQVRSSRTAVSRTSSVLSLHTSTTPLGRSAFSPPFLSSLPPRPIFVVSSVLTCADLSAETACPSSTMVLTLTQR
jgi:hypothetical protein